MSGLGTHSDPLVQALIDHRYTSRACLCGWDAVGMAHVEHVANVVSELLAGQLEAQAAKARQVWDRYGASRARIRMEAFEDAVNIARGGDVDE